MGNWEPDAYNCLVHALCRKRAVHAVFWPRLRLVRMGHGPGMLFYQEMSPHSLCSFVLHNHHIAAGQPHCCICPLILGEGSSSAIAWEGWAQANCPAWLPRGTPWLPENRHYYWYLTYCCFSMCVKCSSIWCLTVLFSMVTPVPKCSGQKCLDFYSWWQATDATL